MRGVPLDRPWKGYQPRPYRFLIFNFSVLNIEKTSKFWAASYKNESNILLVEITVCIESFHPIGWRTLSDDKIRQSAVIFWFGLLDVGILQIFYSRVTIQRKIIDSSPFLEHGSAEKIVVSAQTNRDTNKQEVGFFFVWSGWELWSLFKYSKLKWKSQKSTVVDDFYKAQYRIIPLSCRSNLAGRYF